MILFPNAKINLGLRILSKRPDGYHNISSVMMPVSWSDILEVVTDTGDNRPEMEALYSDNRFVFYLSGLDIAGNPSDNLCVKAAHLFFEYFPSESGFLIHLHKILPSGAGLGGGSSDAAFLLKALNELSGFPASPDELEQLASRLGSDCPFFIRNEPALASGRGELLQPLQLNLKGYAVAILKPSVSVSTAEAYAAVQPNPDIEPIDKIICEAPETWHGRLVNDFESGAVRSHPVIADLLKQLSDAGAVYASMSGSGSAVFGIFKGSTPVFPVREGVSYWSGNF